MKQDDASPAKDHKDSRHQLEPQLLFDRSRASGFDLLKHAVSLATAVLGVYFLTLTGPEKHVMPPNAKPLILFSLGCMVLAVVSGLLAWGADAAFYNAWAQSNQKEGVLGRRWAQRRVANRVRFWALIILVISFAVGIVCSGLYLRVLLMPPNQI